MDQCAAQNPDPSFVAITQCVAPWILCNPFTLTGFNFIYSTVVYCVPYCCIGATQKAVWTSVLLNTLTLAMTCSTYFQLCGNGGAREGLQGSSFLHQASLCLGLGFCREL